VDTIFEAALIIAIAIVLCLFAYHKQLMSPAATVAAAISAIIIGFCGGIWWEVTMILFPAFAFIATKAHFEDKKAMGLQEGNRGCRGLLNILGVILFPTIVSVIYHFTDTADFELTIAFMSALAVSTADTLSSELGVMDPKVYMITTGKPCQRGMNGGVSRYGLLVSAIGAGAFAVLGYLIIFREFSFLMVIPWVAGILGNIIDSVEGAVFENRGLMSKYTVNTSSSMIGAIIGFLIAVFC
jgi:uncharacterized protein (TIGR00297 family)